MPPQNPGHQLHGLFPGRYGGKGARLGWAPAMRLSLCQSWKHPKNGELFITFLVEITSKGEDYREKCGDLANMLSTQRWNDASSAPRVGDFTITPSRWKMHKVGCRECTQYPYFEQQKPFVDSLPGLRSVKFPSPFAIYWGEACVIPASRSRCDVPWGKVQSRAGRTGRCSQDGLPSGTQRTTRKILWSQDQTRSKWSLRMHWMHHNASTAALYCEFCFNVKRVQ